MSHPVIQRGVLRLLVSFSLGLCSGILMSFAKGWAFSLFFGWDIGTLALIYLSGHLIVTSNAKMTQKRSSADDPGRNWASIMVTIASAISFFASAFTLHMAKGITPGGDGELVLACMAAVVLSWILTHTTFTLRYARLYYSGKSAGGLVFPGDEPPDDLDFAYFAFTIGMTFQVSDVVITKKGIRKTVLFHSLLSFACNTVLLALALNVFFGLLGR